MTTTKQRILYEGGPFHGVVLELDWSFPEDGARLAGGLYAPVGVTEAGLTLVRWTPGGPEKSETAAGGGPDLGRLDECSDCSGGS